MEHLVLMEVGRKQSYIFKSNKLKENIGASQIIQYVTEILPVKKLGEFKGQEIMRGGGKSLYSFNTSEEAVNFIKVVSEEVLEKFPGLDVYFVRDSVDELNDDFVEKIEELYIKLGNKKSLKKNSMKQISFGIEKICRSTGLAATHYDKDEVISEEVNTKRKFYDNSSNLSIVHGREKDFPKVLDELKKEDNSYIAVIHIDGNSMGSKFVDLANEYKKLIENDKTYNKKYLADMNKLSRDIDSIYTDAFGKVIDASMDNGKATIRPIIFAGDDVTFVCKAEDAIKLCKIFIEEINKNTVMIGQNKVVLNAAAGIAFVKSHYPFSRAYDLAEELCANCKTIIKKHGKDKSMIDWHILQGENSQSIQEIRKEQYVSKGLNLTMRPLYINDNEAFNNIENFTWTLKKIQDNSVSRNKIKTLRGEYTKGEESASVFINYYKLNKDFDWFNKVECTNGIYNSTAVFFDAIEIMDLVKEV